MDCQVSRYLIYHLHIVLDISYPSFTFLQSLTQCLACYCCDGSVYLSVCGAGCCCTPALLFHAALISIASLSKSSCPTAS